MDVSLTEEQEFLRSSARDFLAAECPMALVRRGVDPHDRAPQTPAHLDPLWRAMAKLGWMGLVIPESHGGAGLGFVDLAVLLEEMGRALMPAPFLSTVALGAHAIALAGSESQHAALLPRVARGEIRITLAQCERGGDWDPDTTALPATVTQRGDILEGRKLFVPDADTADLFVVAARAAEGLSLFLVERDAPGVEVRRIDFIDRTRSVCEITFAGVRAAERLGPLGQGATTLTRVNDAARVALAAECSGAAHWALDAAVSYAKTREQFGRPIGSFQAIAHKCADMFVLVESARSAAYYAAWALEADAPDAHASTCMAKAYCADAFAEVAAQAIQVHGGLGFTWEQDLHLYYKRAKACQVALGDAVFTRELAARVLIDGRSSSAHPAAGS